MADTFNVLSLCSGVGMLDIGLHAACDWLGWPYRCVGYCERDAYAAACLLARMAESSLEPAPVWCGDLSDLDARPLRGWVDCIAAGLPCQPYSVAGKQRGNADERSHGEDGGGPLPHFLRIVAECQPSLVFLENVPPWVCGGWFRPFGEELCRLGYTLESPLFVTAESVGASHRRERVFILAYAGRACLRQRDERGYSGRESCDSERAVLWQERKRSRQVAGGEKSAVGQSLGSNGRINQPGRGPDRRTALGRAGEAVADTRCNGEPTRQQRILATATEQAGRQAGDSELRRAELADAERSGLPLFAPGPGADWCGIPPHLWPATEPGLRVLVDGRTVVLDASRVDALRCGGNGCVPLCAAVAFAELVERITEGSPCQA